jgi:hypothetical protein
MNVDRIGEKPMAARKTAYMRLLPAAAHDLRSRCKKDARKSKKGKHTKILASPRQRSSDTPEAFSVNLMKVNLMNSQLTFV